MDERIIRRHRSLRGRGVPERILDMIARNAHEPSACIERVRDSTGGILVLSGCPGCGKTTAAAWAVAHHWCCNAWAHPQRIEADRADWNNGMDRRRAFAEAIGGDRGTALIAGLDRWAAEEVRRDAAIERCENATDEAACTAARREVEAIDRHRADNDPETYATAGAAYPSMHALMVHVRELVALENYGRFDPEALEPFESRCLLVIDDLGVEVWSDRFQSMLDGLLDTRYSSDLATILTTNLHLEAFRSRYGARITDRIRGSGGFFESAEPSRRKTSTDPPRQKLGVRR